MYFVSYVKNAHDQICHRSYQVIFAGMHMVLCTLYQHGITVFVVKRRRRRRRVELIRFIKTSPKTLRTDDV